MAAALFVIFLLVAAFILPTVDWQYAAPEPLSGAALWSSMTIGFTILASTPLSFINSPDIARYLPRSTKPSHIAAATALGGAVPFIVFTTVGVLLATGLSVAAFDAGIDVALLDLLPAWLGPLLVIGVVINTIALNAMTTYTSSMALQAIGFRLRRIPATIIVGVVGTALTIYLVLSSSLLEAANLMLQFLVIVSGPAMAIFVVDVLLRRYAYDGVELFDDHPGRAVLVHRRMEHPRPHRTAARRPRNRAVPGDECLGRADRGGDGLHRPFRAGRHARGRRALRRPAAHVARKGGPAVSSRRYINGRIFTADPDLTKAWAEAFAIDGETIVFVGSDVEAPDADTTVDLKGRLVLPGFTDAHTHLLMMGAALGQVPLTDARTLDEIQNLLRDARAANPNATVLRGRGWLFDSIPGGTPTAAMIDAAVADIPVYLDANDYHSCWVNSAGLAELGITRDTPDPLGGQIGRDAGGEPTGLLLRDRGHPVRVGTSRRDDDRRRPGCRCRSAPSTLTSPPVSRAWSIWRSTSTGSLRSSARRLAAAVSCRYASPRTGSSTTPATTSPISLRSRGRPNSPTLRRRPGYVSSASSSSSTA